jgi:DNA-directed RNA polymerase II subunit RPB9
MSSPIDSQMDVSSPNNPGNNTKKIAFMFCKKWCVLLPPPPDDADQSSSNMLYPLEEENNLLFKCRNCKWETPATSNCVYRNDLSTAVGETSGVTQDIGQDPTVGFHHSFPDMCTVCGDEIVCEDCGKATISGCWLEVDDDAACEDDGDDFFLQNDDDFDMSGDVSDPMSDDDHGMYVVPNPGSNAAGSAVGGEQEQSREPGSRQASPEAHMRQSLAQLSLQQHQEPHDAP